MANPSTRSGAREHQSRVSALATGPMVAGNVGAKARLSFTVHGDAVNTASRLEQENKVLGTQILISETTRNLLADPDRVAKAGDVLLRGRHTTTELFTTRPDK